MTFKEQRFEQLVNAVQARHDEIRDLIEWRRRKDVEEEAIAVYFELDKDLPLFIEQMRTFDQQETEFQCQRKGEKLKNLYPERFPLHLRPAEVERQERIRRQEADKREREQQRINSVAVAKAKFKADVQASIHPITSTKRTTNAAGSQKASEEYKRSDNQTACSTGAGSSRQQEHKTTLIDDEKRRQFLEQVRSHAEASRSNSQTASTTGVGSSRQQELKATLSDEEKCSQVLVQDQVHSHSGTSHASDQIASSAAAAPSEQQGDGAIPSAEGYGHLQSQGQSSAVTIHINNQSSPFAGVGLSTESHSQDQVQIMPARAIKTTTAVIPSVTPETATASGTTTPPALTEADPSVTAETAAAAQKAYKMEFDGPVPAASKDSFTAELAGYQPRMGICHGVHYPKGAVLVNTRPGLAKLCLGGSSVVPQSQATNIGQGLNGHQTTGSGEYSPTGTSSHRTSSRGSTPPSSFHSSPPKSPIMYPLNAPGMHATNTQNEESDNTALFRQLEAYTYRSVKSTNLFAKQKSSRRDDPFITSVL